jgi:hypothetical protein
MKAPLEPAFKSAALARTAGHAVALPLSHVDAGVIMMTGRSAVVKLTQVPAKVALPLVVSESLGLAMAVFLPSVPVPNLTRKTAVLKSRCQCQWAGAAAAAPASSMFSVRIAQSSVTLPVRTVPVARGPGQRSLSATLTPSQKRGSGTPPGRIPASRLPTTLSAAGDEVAGGVDESTPASALGKHRREISSSPRFSAEQELRDQRAAWYAKPRSFALGPHQILRAPRSGKTMAMHFSGSYTCTVCQQMRWQDAPGFSPLFFMQCGNLTCEEIVGGT